MAFDIHATNVVSSGAVQVTRSLLDAFARIGADVGTIWLPDRGPLAEHRPGRIYARRLPNCLSRVAECLRWPAQKTPMLVLGDLPLAHVSRQVLLLQSPNLFPDRGRGLRYRVAQSLFRRNLPLVSTLLVQTEEMERRAVLHYPAVEGRVKVVGSPPPQWVAASGIRRGGRIASGLLRLFYPAASYGHKNHALLYDFARLGLGDELVDEIVVTRLPQAAPALLSFVGTLEPSEVLREYARTDALVFPSLDESYGLPLIEAMTLDLPVVCADRGYARALCGDGALYFDPLSASSLEAALRALRRRLDGGWWPDWSARLATIPSDWAQVAEKVAAAL